MQNKNIALIGSPNVGKSLLFNKLTGLNNKVANYAGATVSVQAGKCRFKDGLKIWDYPGAYSMRGISSEEKLAVETFVAALEKKEIDAVVVVLDAVRLEKSLLLALQVLSLCKNYQVPVIFALNMIDVVEQNNMQVDIDGLKRELGIDVVPVSARQGIGLEKLLDSVLFPNDSSHLSVATTQEQSEVLGSDKDLDLSRARDLAETYGPRGDLLIRSSERIDRLLLSPVLGLVFFCVIMYLLFQSIFSWAAPLMDGVETGLTALAGWVVPAIPVEMLQDFSRDAIFGGVGAFLVFVPQIFVLTLIIGIMEDSGYLSRAAIICHRPLRWFGLTGKSFVPMLSGVACAIPGIYAARTVDSPVKRELTYMAIPLMPCSARLPVYSLLIVAFIPSTTVLGGFLGLQGLAMFSIYLFGILAGLLATAFVSRVAPNQEQDLPFVLEVPPYRVPSVLPLLKNAWQRSMLFVKEAGPIIFIVSVIVWALGYFPNGGEELSSSYLAYLGRLIEPVFEPFGLDWIYGVAILTSFLAREVFVGTLGTLLGIDNGDENIVSLAEKVQASALPLSVGVALMVFFALSLMCVSTLAVLRRETGSWRLPVRLFIAYGVLAYLAALAVFELFSATGF